jgi:adhesin/invasin
MRQQGFASRVVLGGFFLLWSLPLFGQTAIKIMPLGDSITLGDKSTTLEGYRKDLYTLLTNAGVTVDFVGTLTNGTGSLPDKNHEGHGGFKADQLLANINTYLGAVNSEKAILLHIGTNDLGNGETALSTILEIDDIVDAIKNHDSNIEIFLATLVPVNDIFDNKIDSLNASIIDLVSSKRALGYNIFLVHQNAAFKNNANWATQLMFDSVHPNDDGYDLMAATWFNAFIAHSQHATNNFVDKFNRASLGTTDWTAHVDVQIVGSAELGNNAIIADWSDGASGYFAIQNNFTNATHVSFTYGAGLANGVTDLAGVLVLFDGATTTSSGYFINRYKGNGTTTGTNSDLRLWRVVNGIIQSPNLTSVGYSQGAAQPGDEFSVEIITNANGHTFKCYLNGVLDGTLNDAAKTFDPPTRYSGVMIYGAQGAAARIDNFSLQQAADDAEAPEAVTDLEVVAVDATSATLSWTAPGDDGGNGTALSYDLRYAATPILDDAAFNAATAATGIPAPQSAGNTENIVVGGLDPGTTYYFALKTSDDVGNLSDLSNEATGTTASLIVTTDDFNRPGPDLGSDWVADSPMQIVDVGLGSDNELSNTSIESSTWKLAVLSKRKNVTNVSFRWGVNADNSGIGEGGPALLLDAASITANGYMAQWRTSLNKVRVLKILNGQPDTPVDEAIYTENDPQAGDIVEIRMTTDETGLHFAFYVNGVYYKRLTDSAKPNFNFGANLYAGVILQSTFNNNIDDFTVAVAPGAPAVITKISGDAQADTVSQKLPLPFVVRVEDANGNPSGNVGINFSVTSGGGSLDSPSSPDGNIRLQAESGSLTAPMAAVSDTAASNDKYIVSTTGPGKATFVVQIAQSGSYRVWGRTIAPNGNSDSFFFKADNDPKFYWKVQASSSWIWDTISNDDVSSATKIFSLTAGTHTFIVENRDPGTKLDMLIITSNANFTPEGKEEFGYLTDVNGLSQAFLTLGPNVGANIVQASFGTLTPVSFTATGVGGNASQIVKTSGDNQNGAGGAALAQPFVVTVNDVQGNPVTGHPVNFLVTQGGGSLSNSQPVLTNASGQASTTLTLGREIATQKVEAQAPGLSGSPIVFTATATSGIASTLQKISGDNQSATVATTLTNPIIIKVTDSGGGAIPNYPVEMAATRGGGSVSARNRLLNAGFEGGETGSNPFIPNNWQLLGSPSANEVDVVTNEKHSGTQSVRLALNGAEGISQGVSLTANTSYTLRFWAKVASGTLVARWFASNAGGNPVTVELQVPAASNANTWKEYKISALNVVAYSNNVELTTSAAVDAHVDDVQLLQNTDANGQISATWTLGDTAMVQKVEVTSFANSVALSGSPMMFAATGVAGVATTMSEAGGNNQTGSAGAPLAQPIRVKITDSKGNPKGGISVNFLVTAGGGSFPGSVTSLNVNSDPTTGFAEVVPILGPVAGAINNFKATATGLIGSPITFAATASIPNSFTKTNGDNQIASASLPVATPLTVRIADVNNLPIVNYDVLFEVIQGNGKINGSPSITLKTDANGEAKGLLVLGPNPGAVNRVRASATFNNAPIAGSPLTFTVTAAKLKAIAIVSGHGQTGAVGLPLAQPFKAIVTDSLGNGIKGQNVTFKVTGGGGKLDGTVTTKTVQSDSLGIGQTTLTLGTTPGTNNNTATAEASFNNVPLTGSPAQFTASATPGAPTTLVLMAGNNQSVVVNNQLPEPLKVKIADSFGNGVSGFSVKFKIKSGGGKVNGADSVIVGTASDGVAQVNMTVGTASGLNNNTCEVTALNGPVHLAGSPLMFIETATASVARNMVYASGDDKTGIAGTPLADFFIVNVKDINNNNVPNHPVTFKVILGNGRLDGGVDTLKTVLTDANGQAKVKLTLGPVAGVNNNVVRATSNDGVSPLTGSPIDFTASANPGPPSATVSSVQAATPVAANGTDKSTVTITVRDNFGNPLQGVPLAILVNGSNNFIDPVLNLTDEDGQASGSFASTRAEVKVVTARVIGGVEITNGAQVLFTPLAAAKLVSCGGNSQLGNVGTALDDPLCVKVTDVFDNVIAGHPVFFGVQSGGGHFVGTQPVLTDAQGVARGILVVGPNPGANVVNANSSGLNGSPVSFTATGTVSVAAKLSEISGNDQVGVAGANLPQQIVAKVMDNEDRPIYNYPVKFKVIFGGGKVNGADSATVQTDAFGHAKATWTMGTEAGGNFCNAIAPALAGSPITFRAQAASGQGVFFKKTNGDGAQGTVATTLNQPLTVRVEDINLNGVSNVKVNFTLTSGTGSLSTTEVFTDENGYASVNITFGTVAGPRTVAATSTNLQPNSLSFTATAKAAAAKSMAISQGNNQSGTISKPLNFPASALVKDQYGNPVSGATVNFVISAGGGSFAGQNPRAVISNNDGIAATSWTLGPNTGANQAQAINNQLTGSPLIFNATGFTNNFPIITDVSNVNISENDHVEFTISATDTDGDPITYGAKSLPPGSVFDSLATRLFSWTPDYTGGGVYNVSFFARDNKGGVDEEIVVINVANVNRPPQIVSHNPVRSDTSLASGINILMKVTATDPDGDGLTYTWFDNGLMVSNTNTYQLIGSVNVKVFHNVQVQVSDGIDIETFEWSIVTKVELANFSVSAGERGSVVLNWKTASESNNAGFNVLRSRSQLGAYERINKSLIDHRSDGEYSFIDRTAEAGNRYYYKLQSVDVDGNINEHGPIYVEVAAPESYALHQNYPNPFNPTTSIGFQMPASGEVTVIIYNLLGQPIRTLVRGERPAGYHTVQWDGRNDRGEQMASGVYHYRLQAGSFAETKKMLLMK